MKSATLRALEAAGTTITFGMIATSETGAKSATGSNGNFSNRKRFTAIALDVISR